MDTGFLSLTVLFLMCLAIRVTYEILKERNRINSESKPVFAVVFTAMCVLWLSWFSLCPSDPYPFDLPGPVRWAGFAVFLLGTVLAVGALFQLKGVENINHLVTSGLFKKVRHPMYIGFISWILGWSVYHNALVSLAVGSLAIVSVLWWRHLEETRLEVQFGDEYRRYRLTTWL